MIREGPQVKRERRILCELVTSSGLPQLSLLTMFPSSESFSCVACFLAFDQRLSLVKTLCH